MTLFFNIELGQKLKLKENLELKIILGNIDELRYFKHYHTPSCNLS